MNALSFSDFRERFAHRVRLRVRIFDIRRRVSVFSSGNEPNALRRIYAINLDRKPDRWRSLRRELDRFTDRHGARLSVLTRRFSAVDARYLKTPPDASVIIPTFTLADQLAVHPNPLLQIDKETRAREITMTRQEIAVALSHIEVWNLIADGDVASALVVEDDVFMAAGFARRLQEAWSVLHTFDGEPDFDLLYLAFRDVGDEKPSASRGPQRRLEPGVWEASAYVLSREGAQNLLDRLPVRGPIDLWLNMQFASLRIYTAAKPMIEQRIDEPSTNSYSVLPVLSQVGVITREKPLLMETRKLKGPVFAFGPAGSGLTSLAEALSMLGYTCISDLDSAPAPQLSSVLAGRTPEVFNAYVNLGSLGTETLRVVASMNGKAQFISTSPNGDPVGLPSERLLQLGPAIKDKWAALSDFLEIDYPPYEYPNENDIGQRATMSPTIAPHQSTAADLEFDRSPWIVRNEKSSRRPIAVHTTGSPDVAAASIQWFNGDTLDGQKWKLRDDTFPSNLALFRHDNFSESPMNLAALTLRAERSPVREFTSAAIASQHSYLYGSFSAELRPSNVSGLITGLFLHRNGPRQEIDIEFLGKDTTKMLVNVYFNPGPVGTKLEYGYRGTPTLIDLGFDAADDFHRYEIEWRPNSICWKVDEKVVYERQLWDPTPIPDRPLEFNVNLWHSRSTEFAGRLASNQLPATSEIRSIQVRSRR